MIRLPESYQEVFEDIMSNCDRTINYDVAEQIKGKKMYSHYAGWDFNGLIWYKNKAWHCEVWCYRCYQCTMSADTLEDIMEMVSDRYGYD